jgi:hypothetical protein
LTGELAGYIKDGQNSLPEARANWRDNRRRHRQTARLLKDLMNLWDLFII